MKIDIEIPVKSYLKKFITISFGEEIKLSERNWLGIIIFNIVKRKTFQNYYDSKMNENLDASFSVKISLDKSYRYGCLLLPTQIHYINLAIDNFFKSELIKQALINQSAYQIDFKTSIINILDAYDITEDELEYDSVRKHFNRNYKKYKNRLFL